MSQKIPGALGKEYSRRKNKATKDAEVSYLLAAPNVGLGLQLLEGICSASEDFITAPFIIVLESYIFICIKEERKRER